MRKDRDVNYLVAMDFHMQEEFEDTKGIIKICISKNRQRNGQKKSTKGQTMTYKTYI